MKKIITISLFTILLLFLTSCSNEFVCNSPYIQVGSECCLDSNNDSICDTDEVKEEEKNNSQIIPAIINNTNESNDEEQELGLPQEILDLKEALTNIESYEFTDVRKDTHNWIKGNKGAVEIKTEYVLDLKFYYNKVLLDFENKSALGFCDNNLDDGQSACQKNSGKKYILVNYSKYIPSDPFYEIKSLDNGEIYSTIECETRICTIIKFLKDNELYYLYVRDVFPMTYNIYPVGSKPTEKILYTDTVFNDVKDEDVILSDAYILLRKSQDSIDAIRNNIKKIEFWEIYIDNCGYCKNNEPLCNDSLNEDLLELYEYIFQEDVTTRDLNTACKQIYREDIDYETHKEECYESGIPIC